MARKQRGVMVKVLITPHPKPLPQGEREHLLSEEHRYEHGDKFGSASVTINTKKVQGRRELHFAKLADIQTEAERLASRPVRQLGNWPLGYSLAHLAGAMKMSLDGVDFECALVYSDAGAAIQKAVAARTDEAGLSITQERGGSAHS